MSLLFHIVCVLAHHRAASLPFLRQGRAAWWCSLAPHLCQNPQIIIFKFEWILNNIAALAVGVVKALSLGVEAAWWTGPSVFYLPMWVNSCCSRWESKENTSVDLFSPDWKKKKKRERDIGKCCCCWALIDHTGLLTPCGATWNWSGPTLHLLNSTSLFSSCYSPPLVSECVDISPVSLCISVRQMHFWPGVEHPLLSPFSEHVFVKGWWNVYFISN